MIKILLMLVTITLCVSALAAIKIDGNINQAEWENAEVYELQYEISPARNTKAKLKTIAYVKSDADHLFVAMMAYADVEKLRATIKPRDSAFMEDFVGVILETYRDDRFAIGLAVNAKGSQMDLKQTPGQEEDIAWNMLFDSAVTITEDGYAAEFSIPFSGLQYPTSEDNVWNIGFLRKSFELGSQTLFTDFPLDPSADCLFCSADKEYKLGKLNESKRKYFYPFLTLNQLSDRPNQDLKNHNPDYEVGVSGLIDITKNSTFEFTINPDFSQIEADVSQITANQTFAISFPERRTFFLEGAELLKTNFNTVYTRSINSPQGAIKYINEGKSHSTFLMEANDSASPYIAGGLYQSYLGNAGKSKVSIARYKKNLGNQSHVGALATNRRYQNSGSGKLIEVDGRVKFKEIYFLNFDFVKSYTQESKVDFLNTSDTFNGKTYAMDGEQYTGDGKNITLERKTENSFTGLKYEEISPNFRADLGFVTRSGFKQETIWHSKTFRSDGWLRVAEPKIIHQNTYDHKDQKIKEFGEIGVFIETAWSIRGELLRKFKNLEQYKSYKFNDQQYTDTIYIGYLPSEEWQIDISGNFGDSIAYNLDKPVMANQKSYAVRASYSPTDNASIILRHRYAELSSKTTNKNFYNGSINRISGKYSFNNDLSFKVTIEKNDFSNNYYFESLLQWQPDPYTIFYAGGSQFFEEPSLLSDNIRLETSQVYLKFQYFYNPNS